MKRLFAAALLAAAPLAAQFQLYSLDGVSEVPVPPVHNLGAAGRGDALTARYRLRNASPNPAPLRLLEVAGAGFALATPVTLPQNVPGGGAVEFSVVFRAAADGQYSAALRSEGVSVLLTASVVAQLVVALETPSGPAPLASGAAVSCGSIERGGKGAVRLLVRNQTGREEVVPTVSVAGEDFSLAQSPAGRLLKPLEDGAIEVAFTPTVSQTRRGTLTVGALSFALTGAGLEPPLPRPGLSVALPDPAASGQKGAVAALLAERSRTSGKGSVTLTLRPTVAGAVDPGLAFGNGSRSIEFAVAPGDDRVYFADQPTAAFDTGTTAGTLVVTLRVGDVEERREIELPAAPATLQPVDARRTPAGIEVRVKGFDNTRTAGPVAFTFFDKSGQPIDPGTIRADLSADLGRYFQTSEIGGVFELLAAFPVTGDASGVEAVEVEVGNAAGVGRMRGKVE